MRLLNGLDIQECPRDEFIEEPANWIERAGKEDHLKANWETNFRRESVPVLKGGNNVLLLKLLASLPRLEDPRPGLAFSLRRAAFTREENLINTLDNNSTSVSDKSLHTFFIVECETKRSIMDAENQACSGGAAALVHAKRQFHANSLYHGEAFHRGLTSVPHRVLFSLTLTPESANLFVHLADVRSDTILYHMNLVKSYQTEGRRRRHQGSKARR